MVCFYLSYTLKHKWNAFIVVKIFGSILEKIQVQSNDRINVEVNPGEIDPGVIKPCGINPGSIQKRELE